MALPRMGELADWFHLTLLNGDDVLIAIRQIKAVHADPKSGGTAIYLEKVPLIVQEPIETVYKHILSDETGGTNRR